MAVLSVTGPVVLLTVELSVSFVVPVRQDTAAFTTPKGTKRDDETVRRQEGETDLGCKRIDTSEMCSSRVT